MPLVHVTAVLVLRSAPVDTLVKSSDSIKPKGILAVQVNAAMALCVALPVGVTADTEASVAAACFVSCPVAVTVATVGPREAALRAALAVAVTVEAQTRAAAALCVTAAVAVTTKAADARLAWAFSVSPPGGAVSMRGDVESWDQYSRASTPAIRLDGMTMGTDVVCDPDPDQ